MSDIGRLLGPQLSGLRRYARALTRDNARADDLVQTCFAHALAKQHLWREGSNLRAWLYTVLHNEHVSQIRRYARERDRLPTADIKPAMLPGSDPETSYRLAELATALEKLSSAHREAVLLVGLRGGSYDQVAEILDIPVGTVRSRVSRGREHLRNLTDEGVITQRSAKAGTMEPSAKTL
jgi:RNA polymerase sigma-70 factor, ECF subfamily